MIKNVKTEPSVFALIGAAGYVAPRHLQAIKDTGSQLVAAVDPHDSVGILDRYFPETRFFKEFERFDRFLEKLRRDVNGDRVDYVSICSPNYLHDAHIRFALRIGANAICEKPVVINPWNLDALQQLEDETGKSVNIVLQLRLHPALISLKQKLNNNSKKHKVVLTYITPRGPWYQHSWKGNESQSGGLSTNLGIHLFDLLIWLFGSVEHQETHIRDERRCSGTLELENATVCWFLSIAAEDIPQQNGLKSPSFRSISVDGETIEFSDGFTDLHTEVYKEVLAGKGFSIQDAKPSIDLVYQIRKSAIKFNSQIAHPLATLRNSQD